MQPRQQRVIDEKAALDEKLAALKTFLGTEIFEDLDVAERWRLVRQEAVMTSYSLILAERIAAFAE